MVHARTVRITHWIFTLCFVALAVSGAGIVLAHPRFYWGEAGYFDTTAAFVLPLAVNKHHTSWGRGLHFFAAWVMVLNGLASVGWGVATGHFRLLAYVGLQKWTYRFVVFVLFPLIVLTGISMSPGITAALPWLFTMFGGRQSARTIHFLLSDVLVLFVVAQMALVIRAGFRSKMRTMIAL